MEEKWIYLKSILNLQLFFILTFSLLHKRYKGVNRNLSLEVQVTLSFSYYTANKFLEHKGKK
ncbi:hypothetical protein CWB79_03310 [Pseudoalteromonas sp. S1649]|uniref:Uncharacterized protein n=1 Tax=Pseudoalteromonas lipolytica TaxID=570156 RepID=A0A0N8HK80_9GAMM|nr:hypothetical protein AOG27_13865 [Pseudoalteromonas lipolytica]TMP18596.1 hypothetical protein CWC02_09210 [Pseudoalteromonas sp. S2721]TMP44482.1 hypothetical protein CWB80_14390 [Pseudoalteromonas sp. S1650]TMP69181.1 hypothetical protein CWB79_03310 [Pseudoalteromonas sp. S1649]